MIRSYAAGNYDFILIDTPGGTDAALVCAADSADAALIVSTEQAASIRSAERTGRYLQELGVANRRLVVNCFSGGLKKSEKRLVRLLQVIDTVSIPLIGVVPFERNVWFSKTGEQLLDQSPLKNTCLCRRLSEYRGEGRRQTRSCFGSREILTRSRRDSALHVRLLQKRRMIREEFI